MGKRFERQMQSMARADAQVAALNRQIAELEWQREKVTVLERRIVELEAENRALRTPVPEAHRRAFEGGVA